MRLDKSIEKSMAMDDATWARHANPLSVYTRIPILPLFAFAVWSRVWIGWWCLVPIILLIAWTFYNPRAFPAPSSLESWASRGVLGERIWLARKQDPIPPHHACWALGLSIASGLSIIPMLWGLYALDFWPTVLGTALVVALKLWFVDRMVWLHDETTKST